MIDVICDKLDGMVPVSILRLHAKYFSSVRSPNSTGTDPVKWLKSIYNVFNCMRLNKFDGMVPVNKFTPRKITSRDSSSPNQSGRVLVN